MSQRTPSDGTGPGAPRVDLAPISSSLSFELPTAWTTQNNSGADKLEDDFSVIEAHVPLG